MNKEIAFLNGINLTHEAEAFLGPWRPMDETEVVDPSHINETEDGTRMVPTRLYRERMPHNFYPSQIFAADD